MKLLVLFLAIVWVAGCGKFGPPVPPEALAPSMVQQLEAAASTEGVRLAWRAPESDRRGKALKSLEGYRIYRRILNSAAEQPGENADAAQQELIATISDVHLEELERLREEARQSGKPARRVKVDPKFTTFIFADSAVQVGQVYTYSVVPFNQDGREGQPSRPVKVAFNGATSTVSELEADSADDFSAFVEDTF